VSQNNIDQGQDRRAPDSRDQDFHPASQIRIVLEGFRREVTVSDLCRREGIKPGVFYAWTKEFKEFMEACKARLTRDTVRDATRQEIEHHDGRSTTGEPRSEAACCRPFPGGPPLQKNGHPSFRRGRAHERPGEVERHKPGGRDPVGKTEDTHPTAGAQE